MNIDNFEFTKTQNALDELNTSISELKKAIETGNNEKSLKENTIKKLKKSARQTVEDIDIIVNKLNGILD